MSTLSNLVIRIIQAFVKQKKNWLTKTFYIERKACECWNCGRPDDSLLKVDAIVNESYVGRWVFGFRTFYCEEVNDFNLNLCLHAVFNVFWKNCQCLFSIRSSTYHHDRINHSFSERNVWIIFKTISQKFEQYACFLRNSPKQAACRLNCFNLELNAQVRQVRVDLF